MEFFDDESYFSLKPDVLVCQISKFVMLKNSLLKFERYIIYLGEIANNRFKPRITGSAKTNQKNLALAFFWFPVECKKRFIRFVCGGTLKSVALKKNT